MSADDRIQIDLSHEGETVVITLRGELDLAAAPLFSAQFEECFAAGSKPIVVDLSKLSFMDSTGLRSVLMAHERTQEQGRSFGVMPGDGQVARLLSIARVEEHLNLISEPAELTGPA
jgi:anti-anti-sigma factor